MKKEEIRLKIKAQKALLSPQDKADAAAAAFALLEQHAAFMMASKILMYHSLPDELSTLAFIDKWHDRKRFYLPRVNGVNLDILPYEQTHLRLGAFHIEEPTGDDTADINEIEMIIVPGVAYDRNGNRVGRGKGYYDRLLAETKATKVGIAYDFQVVDEIDAEPHDVKVDILITPAGVVKINRR
ncbi:MAG: 5-formyltetrahydrofolate cyclo-ligase [Bacteroidales bacterium]|nr:5-formyltetrahydrofolate cyclo-ligase [Bacteroidales bacterium]